MKGILANWLNGFSLDDLPSFILKIAVVALLAMLIAWIARKKIPGFNNRYFPVLAMLLLVGAEIGKIYMPFAVLMAGGLIFMAPHFKQESKEQSMYLMLVVILGLGAGIGSVIITSLVVLLATAYLWLTPGPKA